MAPDNSYVNFKYPDSFIAGTKGLLRAYHVTPNQGHKASVNAAAFALDKDCFYTASSDKTIRVWNAKTGDFIRSWMPHKNAIWAMRVLGSAIVTGSGDLTIKITDSTSGRIIRTLEGHKGSVWALDVSLDGKNIASASEDTTAAIWELRSGLKLFELKGHKKAVQSVAFSLNGQLVATGSNDETLRIWCLKDGTLLKEVQAPSSVLCMAFTKDSQVLYVGLMAPHGFLAYNIENGTIHRTSSLKDHSLTVLKLISADTKLILGTENGSVILYDLGKNTIVKSCDLVNARINDIDVSSDEHSCLIGMSDGAAYLLDLNTFSGTDLTNKLQTRILGRSEYCLESFCISPDGRDIFSSSEEGVVKCWTLQSGEVFRNWRAHAHFIPDISISSSGRYLITTTEIIDRFKNIDKDEIALWDLKREGEPLRFWVENSYGTILTADFTKDEKSIIAGGNEILILDKETGQKITSINHSGSTITCLAISPDDKAVAIGSILGGISIFDIATKNLLNTIIDEETPWAIKFSSDSKLLFGGGDKRTLFIWETTSGQLKRAYEGHSEHITAIDISKDDRYVASGSDDFTLRVWDIHNNVSYGPFSHSREISEVQFIPRSYIVAASDVNGDIFLWDFLGTEKNVLTSRKLERPNVRVLFIGDKGVGKTSLINCISPTEATAEEDPLDTNSTLGCEVRIVAGDDNLFYWDFGGQRMFRVVHQFFSRGNACIAVIVFDGSRMDSIIPAIDSFRYWIEILIKNFVKKPKIIIVKNKCDQAGTFVMPIEFKNQIMSLVKKYDLKTPQEITTSAKTREGLESLIKNIKEYAADVSTFGQEIYSEMDFDAIDAQLKNYENKGELFIEFGRFFKDCQNTALNNMARKKPDVNKQKGTFTRLNPEDALSEKQIMFYLDHLEASGKLLVLAEYGAEKDYICLKPILVSKILSAVSICAFKNADLIKKSDYPEIFNQLNQDSFFRVDYGDLFRRNAEKWFTQVMNIAVDLNAIIEEIEGAQWRILNYQNQSMPLEFENLIINEKIIQVNYFKIEQIPQTILSLLTNMVINQSKLPLKADWTTEQRCVQWISGKIEHKVEWNDKDEATDILSWSTPQRKAVRVKRFTYTETTAETKEKGEKKAQERSETNINIIFESISPKGIFSPFHLIGYRIYVPLDFEYLPKSEKAFYLNEIKEIAIRFIIRLLDQVTILKWIFPALIICRNRKCRNFILDYTVTQSNLSFCNKCASKLGLIGDLWEKLPEINME
jgi:small GTP-binding protein